MPKKIVTVLGARPQFIKAATVSRAIRETGRFNEVIVHTGQHYDQKMSEVFFDELDLPRPNHMLEVGSGSHGAQTGRMLEAVEKVLLTEKPDWVLVYGDTNSTIAGSLAAAKLHIPVAHVEAGLRSFNRTMPEEINRVVTDHLSDLLFAPTDFAVKQLVTEGIDRSKIHQVGDVMYDSVLHYVTQAERSSRILDQHRLATGDFVLATIHRASNTDDPHLLKAIVDGMTRIAAKKRVVWPLHPRTSGIAARLGIRLDAIPGLSVIDPVGYLDMVMLEKSAAVVVTDSGGVQKEAFFFRVPCVTLREQTEWVETVEAGWNRLVTPDSADKIYNGFMGALESRGKEVNPYGDGKSAFKIIEWMAK
jgi:UDP-GlcNAc3NAcA epimerase